MNGVDISRRHCLAMGAASLVSASARAATRWRFATAYSDAVHHTTNARGFVEAFTRQTGGEVQVDMHIDASLKKMSEILPAVASGEIEMGEVFMSAYAKEIPLLNMDALPFIVRHMADARLMWKVSRSAIDQALELQGIKVLYAVPWPSQALFSRVPLERLTDLKGLPFRVNNEATKRIGELAGAKPATIAASELESAVRDGKVAAMITSSVTGVDSKAWTTLKYFYDVQAWIPKNMVCVNLRNFRILPKAHQEALLAQAAQAEERGWALASQADEEARRQLQAQRVAIQPPSFELRRTLALLGEKMSREWASTNSVENSMVLLKYFDERG